MSGPLTVLVVGAGSDVNQGILTALELSRLECRTVAACVSPTSPGLYLADRATLSPYAADPSFVDWLVDTCRAEGVDAILSGVEPVLDVLAKHADHIRAETGAVAIVSPPAVLAVGADKLRTARWLAEHGLDGAGSAAADDAEAVAALAAVHGYPLLAKPRRGRGSEGVQRLDGPDDLRRVGPGDVVQEWLPDTDGEFTVACHSDSDGNVRGALAMRRELVRGTTSVARLGDFGPARAAAVAIARELRPTGPCNVQLRVADGRPRCFEINVRFSGTVGVRAGFGFNDVEAALRHYVLGEQAAPLPESRDGLVLRHWTALYVDPSIEPALGAGATIDIPATAVSKTPR